MSFSADWLTLRRSADDRARSATLTMALARALAGRQTLRVLDLGCGTGANMAALAPHLPGRQTWVLADSDPSLLARISTIEGAELDKRHVDIRTDLETLFDPAPDLVTASAFFDLCGAGVADEIVRRTADAGAVFHAVLTYDGREHWGVEAGLQTRVHKLFLRDQRRDKGLGPALGPDAPDHLRQNLRARGYGVGLDASDWQLRRPRDAALIEALAHGHANVVQAEPDGLADTWIAAARETAAVMIGHRDLLAVPGARI